MDFLESRGKQPDVQHRNDCRQEIVAKIPIYEEELANNQKIFCKIFGII